MKTVTDENNLKKTQILHSFLIPSRGVPIKLQQLLWRWLKYWHVYHMIFNFKVHVCIPNIIFYHQQATSTRIRPILLAVLIDIISGVSFVSRTSSGTSSCHSAAQDRLAWSNLISSSTISGLQT